MKPKYLSEHFPLNKLETYIEKKVLPKIQMAGSSFSLQATGLGNKNIIFFLKVGHSKVNIFKGFRIKSRIKNNLLANSFLAQCNINVPKILFSDLSQKTFRQFGCFFSCEEKIAGKNLTEIDNITGVIPAVARFYAKIHNLRSSRWGKLTSGRKYGFGHYIMDRVTKRFDTLKASSSQFNAINTKTYLRWFKKRQDSIKTIKHFSLCHSDANRKNILISNSNQVFIIDNEAVKYLPFPIEFYKLRFVLCEYNVEAHRVFKECYFENCPPQKRHEFETCSDFYNAYVLLELACYFNMKLKHLQGKEGLKNYYKLHMQKTLSALLEFMHET
jgi:hypothetical protein